VAGRGQEARGGGCCGGSSCARNEQEEWEKGENGGDGVAPIFSGHSDVGDGQWRAPRSGKEWGEGCGGLAQWSGAVGWPAQAQSQRVRAGGVPRCKTGVAGWLPGGLGPQ
jgi:hypothetical protein